MPWSRRWWLFVPVLGVIELMAHFVFARRAPRPEDWPKARAPLVELRKDRELVVVAPHWAEPLARQAFGEELMPLQDVARADETSYARAIEVSVLGQSASELSGWRAVSERREGAFRFRLLENPHAANVRFDFVDGLVPERVVVRETAAEELRECRYTPNARVSTGSLPGPPTFPARRFACASGEPYFVGVTIIDDPEYRPRRCIWAHPTPGGPLRIQFSEVPLGRVIRGHAGLPWLIMRDGHGVPIELDVRVDGQSIGTLVHHDQDGWHLFEFPTGAEGRTATVEFEVRASDVRERHFCFQADTR